jgi:small subunit ribosomal protein S17
MSKTPFGPRPLAPLTKVPRLERGRVVKVNLVQKMIKVEVDSREPHPDYGKVVTKRKVINVHWEGEQALQPGDVVDIMASRPISKIKHHVFVRKVP